MPIEEIDLITVHDRAESSELAVRSRYGDGIVLQTYPLGGASDALGDGKLLCDLLDVPLCDDITQRLRTTSREDLHGIYTESLAERPESSFALAGPPTKRTAKCEYRDSQLLVHIPPQGCPWVKLLAVVAFLALLILLGGWEAFGYDRWEEILLAALACLVAAAWSTWSMFKAGRYEAWLTVWSGGVILQHGGSAGIQEWELPTGQLQDVWLSDNVGSLKSADMKCIWLGRKALEITGDDEVRAFGVGLSRAELVWLKQLVDWVISGRSEDRLQAVLSESASTHAGAAEEEGALQGEGQFPVEWGASGLAQSVHLDFKYAGMWVVLMGVLLIGVGAARGAARPAVDEPPAPVVDEEFRQLQEKIERLHSDEDFKRALERHRKAKEAQSQPARVTNH